MSVPDLPPLDDDVQNLLEGARRGIKAPPEARRRLWSALDVAALAGTGAGSAAVAKVTRAAWLARWAPVAASFVVGGVVGGTLVFALRPPRIMEGPPRVILVAASAEPQAPTATASIAAPSASVPRAVPTSSEVAVETGGIKAERALLDRARLSLEQGDGAAALRTAQEHEQRFPGGVLAQEREAIAIRALLLLGQTKDARDRLARFRARYPGSALLPTLEAAAAPAPSP
jgi:hypothetical protein